MASSDDKDNRVRRLIRGVNRPAIAALLIAPVFGEVLSGSTPPLDLLLPWNLAFTCALYGCGALICREVARRYGLGIAGLVLLGASYGVLEEGLIDRYWFYPTFWHDAGPGTYSAVWDTNVLLATHLTVFHAMISITSSVLIVERLYPSHRDRAWTGRTGLLFSGAALFVCVPLLYGEFDRGPDLAHLLMAGLVCVALVAAAFAVGHRRSQRPPPTGLRTVSRPGLVAFGCTTAHFLLVYTLPSTGLPWPLAVAMSLVPVAWGVRALGPTVACDPNGHAALRVVVGMLSFFVVLDSLVGLAGRFDLTIGAIVLAVLLRRLVRRDAEAALRAG